MFRHYRGKTGPGTYWKNKQRKKKQHNTKSGPFFPIGCNPSEAELTCKRSGMERTAGCSNMGLFDADDLTVDFPNPHNVHYSIILHFKLIKLTDQDKKCIKMRSG